MKKYVRILLLVLVVLMLCIPFVDFGAPKADPSEMNAKLTQKQYTTSFLTTSELPEYIEYLEYMLSIDGVSAVLSATQTNANASENSIDLFYFESKDAAKAAFPALEEIFGNEASTVLKRSGSVIYIASKGAYDDVIRPAFWSTLKNLVKVSSVSFLVYTVFVIAAVGYLLGRVTIKGVNLGTAGVFLVALLFGCLFYNDLASQLPSYTTNALKIVENIGLILFVTSVGFIAGPKFFGNLKKNFKTYILLGLIIILSGALVCGSCILIAKATMKGVPANELISIMVGLFSGALTSTPAFSASKEAVSAIGSDLESFVAVGNGIAYIFGVIGVVLFVQLVPKFMKADMDKERELLAASNNSDEKTVVNEDGDEILVEQETATEETVETVAEEAPVEQVAEDAQEEAPAVAIAEATKEPAAEPEAAAVQEAPKKKLIDIDPFGIAAFAAAAIIGMILGSIKIGSFSLTTTGGCLLVSLVFGHFRKCGPVNIMPPTQTLKVFRELGLMLFLIGAGVAGGAKFVECFKPLYFLYGALMTLLPMVVGFFFAKYVLKMNLLNSLGSITGGMTSTPALGTLIQVSGTEDVGSSYAATYPIALISVVLCSQFLVMIFL